MKLRDYGIRFHCWPTDQKYIQTHNQSLAVNHLKEWHKSANYTIATHMILEIFVHGKWIADIDYAEGAFYLYHGGSKKETLGEVPEIAFERAMRYAKR